MHIKVWLARKEIGFMDSNEKSLKIKEVLENKKAQEVSIIDIKDKSSIADYFVLATGTSLVHVRALADEVEVKMSELGIDVLSCEGNPTSAWRLLDYGDVIVNVFSKEARDFYNLDKFWLNEVKDSDEK